MVKRATYTQAQRDEALRIYQAEGPTAAAKQTGIPKGTIAAWAKRTGVQTVRNSKMAEAREAAEQDAATIRALVAGKTISAANAASEVLARRITEEADAMPMKDLATVYGILIDKHKVLVSMDAGLENHNAVDAWLDHVMGGA